MTKVLVLVSGDTGQQVRPAWERTQEPTGPISTEASRSFSWQARQVSPSNSVAGLGSAFWEVGQIVLKAQDL